MKLKTVYVVHRERDGYEYSYIFGYDKLFSLFGNVYVKRHPSLMYSLTHFGGVLHFSKRDCFETVEAAKKSIKLEG